ncbi:hypothetical protein Tco_1398038 [Tanacetum coccineum]
MLGLKAFLMLLVLLLFISELMLLSCVSTAQERVNALSEEVSTAELVSTAYLKEFDLLKWDQQIELLSDYDCEIRYHLGKANVVADALSRKERDKPLRVRDLMMTVYNDLTKQIREA